MKAIECINIALFCHTGKSFALYASCIQWKMKVYNSLTHSRFKIFYSYSICDLNAKSRLNIGRTQVVSTGKGVLILIRESVYESLKANLNMSPFFHSYHIICQVNIAI